MGIVLGPLGVNGDEKMGHGGVAAETLTPADTFEFTSHTDDGWSWSAGGSVVDADDDWTWDDAPTDGEKEDGPSASGADPAGAEPPIDLAAPAGGDGFDGMMF